MLIVPWITSQYQAFVDLEWLGQALSLKACLQNYWCSLVICSSPAFQGPAVTCSLDKAAF